MSKKEQPDRVDLLDDERYVRHHLEAAGPRADRAAVPAEIVEKITTTARAEWQAKWGDRRAPVASFPSPASPRDDSSPSVSSPSELPPLQGRDSTPAWRRLAMAAAVVASLSVGAWWWLASSPDAGIAIAERSKGEVSLSSATDAADIRLAAGASIGAGAWIETTSGSNAALRLVNGVSLRVDGDSKLRLTSDDQIFLERGAVYIDTGSSAEARRPGAADDHVVTVRTAVGSAWDLGTQFEVRLTDEGTMRIRVREGTVEAQSGDRRHRAEVGDQLMVHADGTATVTPVELYGGGWQWIVESAPDIEIDGRSAGELLDLVERETGWQVVFLEPATEDEARLKPLQGGPTSRLRPDTAAQELLPATGLHAELRDGVLLISTP